MQVPTSVAIMQVLRFHCNDAGGMQVVLSVMLVTPTFHKIDWKTFKDISGLHFTIFVNIIPKLRYFEGRNYMQIG